MIEDLTIENLKKYNFHESRISSLMSKNNDSSSKEILINDTISKTYIFITNGNIYTDKDAIRQKRFRNEKNISFPIENIGLIPEYYDLKLAYFLKKQKEVLNILFVEQDEIEQFKNDEIEFVNDYFKNLETTCNKYKVWKHLRKDQFQKMKFYLRWLNNLDSQPPATYQQQGDDNTALKEEKPIFKPEMIDTIFGLLKDFFSIKDQGKLKKLLLDTAIEIGESLVFLENGNRLADAFKQLKDSDIITGCQKVQLEKWILINFKYTHLRTTKDFKPRYLNDIISSDQDKCKKPILDVKNDILKKA